MMQLRRIVSLVICILSICGCVRRDLVDIDKSAELRIRLMTAGINNVTCNIYNEELAPPPVITSDKLRVMIYNADGTQTLSQGFLSKKSYDEAGYEVISGPISISTGDYKVLGYNFDVENTNIEADISFNSIYAVANEIPQSYYARFGSRASEAERIYFQPEHLMVARDPQLQINNTSKHRIIEMDAETVVDTYYLQIRISGKEHLATKATPVAYFSGLSPRNYIGEDKIDVDAPSSVYVELQLGQDPHICDENNDVIYALVNTFGKVPDAASELKITFSVLTRDGETHQKVIDMLPIFDTEDARERHWLLIDEVWEIPEPVFPDDGEGGGFNPKVEDWDDIGTFIPIGAN